MMILRDRVDVVQKTVVVVDGFEQVDWTVVATNVPAEVSFTTVAVVQDTGRTALVEELRAVIEPRDFDAATHRLKWRGKTYMANGPAMVRRRGGRDHHLTIPIRDVAG
jgi:hypothetical protein